VPCNRMERDLRTADPLPGGLDVAYARIDELRVWASPRGTECRRAGRSRRCRSSGGALAGGAQVIRESAEDVPQ
jgi:hypothetical protein